MGGYELALDINGTGRLSYQGAFLGTYPVTLISAEKKTSWEYVYRGATKRYSTTGTAAFIIEVAGIALYHEHKQIPAIGAAGTGNYENYIQTCLANNVYGSCVSSPVVITAIQTAITLTPYPGF